MQSKETSLANGFVETVVMLLRGVIRTNHQVPRTVRTPFERLFGKKPAQEFEPARPISKDPLNKMNPRYNIGVWLGVRHNSAECFVETAEGVFRAREVRRIEHQDTWDKEAINNVIGVPWRIADGNWTVDRLATQLRYYCRMPGLQCDQASTSSLRPLPIQD